MEEEDLPTHQQALPCFQLCQNLTDMYLSVDMLRLDESTGNAVMIAETEILIEIDANGNWRFVHEI